MSKCVIYIRSIFYLVFLFSNVYVFGKEKDTLRVADLRFVENVHQWPSNVKYRADIDGAVVYLESNCLTFSLIHPEDIRHSHAHNGEVKHNKQEENIRGHSFKINFKGSNKQVKLLSEGLLSDYLNYFIGKDKSCWASNVRQFNAVVYQNIYPSIDLKLYSQSKLFKYDWIIRPGGDCQNIQLEYRGVNDMKMRNGSLVLETSVNSLVEMKPFAYQVVNGEKREIECNYLLNGNTLGFHVGDYDRTKELVIDPALVFSTYTGSTSDNWGFTATYDHLGNVYAGGITQDFGSYPVTIGAFQITNKGIWDIAIMKFDSTGTQRKWATYLGGSQCEMPHSLIVNEFNQLLVFGTTGSSDFPVTPHAFDTSFNGGTPAAYDNVLVYPNGSDIFVSKFEPDGTSLLASTFVGGTSNDGLNYRESYSPNMMMGNDSLYFNYGDGARGEIITDNLNNVYVGSCTFSTDFPITLNGFQQTNQGKQEGVVFKLDYSLSNLVWSSYIGGSNDDAVYSIETDKNYDLFVSGGTSSLNFPSTSNAYKTSYQGGATDAFLSRISQNGNQLISSTFFGSPDYDQAYFVRVSPDNNVYITGQTKAVGSLLIYNALYNTPNSGQFIARFSHNLDTLIWSTVFGTGDGKPNISITAFSVDVCNRIYLAGWGRYWGGYTINGTTYVWGTVFGTKNMDVTTNAYQTATDGQDFYLLVLKNDASALDYATFIGEQHTGVLYNGNDHVDGGTSRFDKRGNMYQSVCASCGGNDAFPTYPNPGVWSNTNNSLNCNNAVFKFNIHKDFALADFVSPPISCVPATINFQNNSIGSQFVWDFGDGSPLSTQQNPTHVYTHSGVYHVKLRASLPFGCTVIDSIVKQVVVLSDTSYNLPDISLCKGDFKQIGLQPNSDTSVTYRWRPALYLNDSTVSNPFASSLSTMQYKLIVSNGVCTDTLFQKVNVIDLIPDAGNDTLICVDSLILKGRSGYPGVKWQWSTSIFFTDTLNTSMQDSTLLVYITSPKTFYLKIRLNECESIDSIHVASKIVTTPISAQNPTCADSCNGQASVNIIGGTPPYVYQWSNNQQTSSISGLCGGTYSVTVTDADHCKSTMSVTLTPPPPLVILLLPDSIPCEAACIGVLNAQVSGGTPPYFYSWSNSQSVNPATNLCSGSYSVLVRDSKNCPVSANSSVVVDSIYLNFDITVAKDTIYKDLSTQITATYIPGCSYTWTPSAGLNNFTIHNPIASPVQTTTYYLTVTDPSGNCTYLDSVTIYVIDILCGDPFVFVPNIFTPNGDGKNDILKVESTIVDNLTFSIYNRWGEKVFETVDIEKGWDGTYKGTMSDPGVFVYQIEARCLNQKYFKSKGNITLIR